MIACGSKECVRGRGILERRLEESCDSVAAGLPMLVLEGGGVTFPNTRGEIVLVVRGDCLSFREAKKMKNEK